MMIKKSDFNGIERYVKKQLDINEITFFPKTSIELSKYETTAKEENSDYTQRFKDIQNSIT